MRAKRSNLRSACCSGGDCFVASLLAMTRGEASEMSKLELTIACGRYDRTQALIDGRVAAGGRRSHLHSAAAGRDVLAHAQSRRVRRVGNVAVVLHDPALGRRHAVHRDPGVPLAGVSPLGDLCPRRFEDRAPRGPQGQAGRGRRLPDDGGRVGARLPGARVRRHAGGHLLGGRQSDPLDQAARRRPARGSSPRHHARGRCSNAARSTPWRR